MVISSGDMDLQPSLVPPPGGLHSILRPLILRRKSEPIDVHGFFLRVLSPHMCIHDGIRSALVESRALPSIYLATGLTGPNLGPVSRATICYSSLLSGRVYIHGFHLIICAIGD